MKQYRNLFFLALTVAWAHGLASALLARANEGNLAVFVGVAGGVCGLVALVFGICWGETSSTSKYWQDHYEAKLKEAWDKAFEYVQERDRWMEKYVELELRLEGKAPTGAQVSARKRRTKVKT